jgi:tetratricopeptide (TPR) repeat protein
LERLAGAAGERDFHEDCLMRRLIRPALFVLLLLCLRLPVLARHVDSAKALYEKGQDAEARQNYEQAFDYFKQAYNQKPKDLRYRTAFERTRFLAASARVHRGQILRDAGKLDEAAVEFQKGLETDPSSFIAQQELKRTQQMIRNRRLRRRVRPRCADGWNRRRARWNWLQSRTCPSRSRSRRNRT